MELDDVRLMRRQEVLQACGFSKTTMYNLIGQRLFPRPLLVGSGVGATSKPF